MRSLDCGTFMGDILHSGNNKHTKHKIQHTNTNTNSSEKKAIPSLSFTA
jgi:hypothetical protein